MLMYNTQLGQMWFLVSLLLLQFCLMFFLLVSTAMFDVLFISYKILIVPGLYTRLYNSIRQSFSYSLSNHFWYLQRINMFHYYFSFDFLLLSSGWLGYLLLIFVFFLLSASVTSFHFCFHYIFNALSNFFETAFTRNIPLWFTWMFSLCILI